MIYSRLPPYMILCFTHISFYPSPICMLYPLLIENTLVLLLYDLREVLLLYEHKL